MYSKNNVLYILQDNCTVVHLSAQMGHVEITELLIDGYGLDPASKTNVTAYVANSYLCDVIHLASYIICIQKWTHNFALQLTLCISYIGMQLCTFAYVDVAMTFHMYFAIQTGVTPMMLAAMFNHHNVVSLLKNKYGQQEPVPEEMVSYILAQLLCVCTT